MKLDFAGIKRKEIYSPNHITNDSLLLARTAEQLELLGHNVKIYEEVFVETNEIQEKFIFSMAQGKAGITSLLRNEERGDFIINKPSAALNSYRTEMIKILTELNNLPFPKSVEVKINGNTDGIFEQFGQSKVWLKRGDVHAEHKEDVTLVYSKEEMVTLFKEFKNRGIERVIVQQHLSGDTIKFYGILGTEFFHWYYLNGNNHIPFDLNELKLLAFWSAEVLDLDIFGGDVIISPDGSISIIDINDWPSFAPVRDIAAKNIAQLIHNKALKYVQHNKQKEKFFQNNY